MVILPRKTQQAAFYFLIKQKFMTESCHISVMMQTPVLIYFL